MSDFTLDLTPRGTLAIDCVTNGPITTNTTLPSRVTRP